MKKIELYDHVLESTEKMLVSARLLLDRLTERCDVTGCDLEELRAGNAEIGAEYSAFIFEIGGILRFVAETFGSQEDLLQRIRGAGNIGL
jgi:hypothetical protein